MITERRALTTIQSRPFAEDGRLAVNGLRQALADVLFSVGADPGEPQELSRKFGLDKTLTWKISRVVREDDAWEAVQHIPRRPSIEIFTRAMTKHGAPNHTVESLWDAVEVFEHFIETHSGDRETLEMMAGASAKRTASKRMEAFRKSGYQAGAAVWGVHARLQLASQLIAPGAADGTLDLAVVCGLLGFRRLRANVPWAVASVHAWDGESEFDAEYPTKLAPIDPSIRRGDVPLLRQFCSQPQADMLSVEHPAKTHRFMLAEGPVGKTAAATVFLGWMVRDVASIRQSFPGETGDHIVNLSTPVEELVHDLFIHRDLRVAMNPTAHVYSQLPGGPQYPAGGKDAALLPVPTEVAELGACPPDATMLEIPRYREMIEMAAQRLGHSLNDFAAYRFRLRYPPIPAMAVMRHNLLP